MANELHSVRAELSLSGEPYAVLSLHLREKLDTIPRLVATITRDDTLPKPVTLLGEPVELASRAHCEILETPRHFRGVVTQATRRIDTKGGPGSRSSSSPRSTSSPNAPICAPSSRSRRRTSSSEVLDGAGIPHTFQLGESYEPRPNVIQYRETDFDFLRRFCAEEGIAFAWDHEAEQLVLFDDPHGLGEAADAVLKYIPEFGFGQSGASVQKLTRSFAVTTDKVHLRQYDFEKPRTLVEATVEGIDEGAHALEAYVAPARSVNEGRREAPRTGRSRCSPVAARPLERRVLILGAACRRAFHRRGAPARGARPRAARRRHRAPPRRPPQRCRDDEAQHLALVRGHAHQDELLPPRAKAARGACARRAARDHDGRERAGDRYRQTRARDGHLPVGSALRPRRHRERAHAHEPAPHRRLDVPPARRLGGARAVRRRRPGRTPLVVGRLYNALTMPPYSLPGGAVRSSIQTATTPGGGSSNELRTDDTKGKEEMFFNASKDTTILVKNNATESVGNDATLEVGGNQSVEITNSVTTSIGASQSITVAGNQKLAVETFQVDECGATTRSRWAATAT
jgi:type VI secretion system secreted protein VgrG